MTKPVGATQRKGKKWTDTKKGRDKNYMIASWRKWKKKEAAAKQAEIDRFNNLCGPVTVTYKEIKHTQVTVRTTQHIN